MNSYELISSKTNKPCGVWVCGECNLVTSKDLVDRCCQPCKCGKPARNRFEGKCSDCIDAEYRERRAKQLDNAELVEWDGSMIFSEEVSGYRDGWFDSPDELLDYLEDEEECNKPEFAFLGRKCVNQLNMDRAIERMTEDTYEDAELHITPEDMGKLSEAVDAFNAKYALTYFEHDYKRKVRIVHQVAAAPMAEPDDCKAKPDESLTIADEATTYRRIVPMGGEMYREIDEPIADEATDTKVDD